MLITIICLLLPLGLRYLTSWRMSILHNALVKQESEVTEIKERYLSVREELRIARSMARQHEVRGRFISSDIEAEKRKFLNLQRPAEDGARIAA